MGESFRTLRRLIADQVEPRSWGIGTTTEAGTTTTLISSDFELSAGDGDALESGWVYFTSGPLLGEQRPIRRGGLDVETGEITVATPFSAATPVDAEFEVHLRYPVKRGPGTPWVSGYLEMVNDSLRRLWVADDLATTGVEGQVRYPLDTATYPWLGHRPKQRVLALIEPLLDDGVKRASGQSWWVDDAGTAPVLVLTAPYQTGATFYLRVARPAYTRIKVGGATWIDVSPSRTNAGQLGLAGEYDETLAAADDVLALAITESMNALAMAQPSLESSIWEGRQKYWASVARDSKHTRLPRRNEGRPTVRAAALGGGLMGGSSRRRVW